MSEVAIILFTVALTVWTYWCTRGVDGHIKGAYIGAALFAIIYAGIAYQFPHSPFAGSALHLLIFEVAAIAVILCFSQVDEMAGMLEFLMPVLVFFITLAGFVVRIVKG